MSRDSRVSDARQAAVLQVLAEELRELIGRQGASVSPLAAWPSMLEGVAAEILVGGRRADAALPDRARTSRGPVTH